MAESSSAHFKYDVFLSFRGKDTRYNFTDHLLNAFLRKGIETFFDDQKLEKGDELKNSLFRAIENSKMFVIVFSKNYASSTWCLDELVKILQCAKQNNRRVWPIFYKVDPSDIRHQRNKYGDAMTEQEKRFREDPERVQNWRSALTEVANLKGDHFKKNGNVSESNFISKIVKEIATKLLPKGLHIEKHAVGLEPRVEEVKLLLDISSCNTVCMLGIHGAGGMGKTMLAEVLYNSIVHHFDYASFLFKVREISNQPNGLVSLQKTLLSEMFEMEGINPRSVDEGAFLLMKKFYNKRVLLVLDDIDCKEQLEKLAGEHNWFGAGSRIIVTTRDKHLLHASRIEKRYEMTGLNVNDALELFCWKAFNSNQPPEQFADISSEVVNYAKGLPLALEVIGSNLSGKNIDECKCALDQYKRFPEKRIQDILRISYDSLKENQQKIFLDIACFFKGYDLEDLIDTWYACDFHPKYNIGVLVDKSLITIKWGSVEMHDLLQDMGKEVVRKVAPEKPWRQSRLWSEKDIIRVLEDDLGTDEIEGIMLQSPQQKIQWEGTAFKAIKNLRILIIKDANFSIAPEYLPNSLCRLEWNQCPLTSLPSNFNPKKLVILRMPNSLLKLEKSFKNFEYLTKINFSMCPLITEVHDMSGALALQVLNFSYCKNLVKIHDSIGFLPKVKEMDFRYCVSLKSLPSAMQIASLLRFDTQQCKSLGHFPNIMGNMDGIKSINIEGTAIEELPNSISNLTSLMWLDARRSNLVSIPESMRKLSNLVELGVSGCKNLQEIKGIPPSIRELLVDSNTPLSLRSRNVIWSQAKEELNGMYIDFPKSQIPDWFHHRCKGGVLSFWVRKKLPNAAFGFIYRIQNTYRSGALCLSINKIKGPGSLEIEVPLYSDGACMRDLYGLCNGNRIEELESYLVLEWNYVEIEVLRDTTDTIDECGIYVYEQETRMENVRFECPYLMPMPGELVLRNALKRGAAFHTENEPRTKKRKTCPIEKSNQILPESQHNDTDFPWERLWNLPLPPKVIFFLWELGNCVLPTFDLLQVSQICFLCGVENETSQHIFMQCTFARALWFGSQLSIRLNSLEDPDVVHLVKSLVLQMEFHAEIQKHFICPMALILYTIWYFRNKAIFKRETPSSEAAIKVWLRFCQDNVTACPVTIQASSNSAINKAHVGLPCLPNCKVYLSVHRVKRFDSKITYCQAFIIDGSAQVFEGNFLMSGVATKCQVLFQGFRSLLKERVISNSFLSVYMPNSSYIAMLNNPSMAPPHLQTTVKDINCLLRSFYFSSQIQINCESFARSSSTRSSSIRVKSGRLGSIGKWRFFCM